jgi:hypothetical protein
MSTRRADGGRGECMRNLLRTDTPTSDLTRDFRQPKKRCLSTEPPFARRESRAASQALAAALKAVGPASSVDDSELLVAAAPATQSG